MAIFQIIESDQPVFADRLRNTRSQGHFSTTHIAGVNILVLGAGDQAALCKALNAVGVSFDIEAELYAALSSAIEDPSGYALMVIDCDSLPDPDAGSRALAVLRAHGLQLPVVLVSQRHAEQSFPDEREAPVRLRAPVNTLGLHMALEHRLHERLARLSA